MWELVLLALGSLTAALMMGPGKGQGGPPGGRPGGGGPGRGGPPAGPGMGLGMLLQNASVREELDLSDDQVEEMRHIVAEVRGGFRDDYQRIQKLAGAEQREQMQELGKKLGQAIRQALADLFTPEQHTRLRQIELQVRSMEAFNDPEVQAALKLTEAQMDQIKTLAESARKELQQSIRNARQSNQGEARSQLGTLRRQAVEKVAQAVLGAEQQKLWREMLGEPFDLKIEAPPQGGPGGRPGPGGPRGPGGQGGGQAPFTLDFDDV